MGIRHLSITNTVVYIEPGFVPVFFRFGFNSVNLKKPKFGFGSGSVNVKNFKFGFGSGWVRFAINS